MPDPRLEFDPEVHQYRVDGRILPSVTQVLEAAGISDKTWVPESALIRGTHVHRAIELDIASDLDWSTLDESYYPYMEAWEAFQKESGFVIEASEIRVWHRTDLYAGTLDLRGRFSRSRAIIDIKVNSIPPHTRIQTAGYDRCLEKKHHRFALQLKDTGRYKLVEFKDPRDYKVWQAALTVGRFNLKGREHGE